MTDNPEPAQADAPDWLSALEAAEAGDTTALAGLSERHLPPEPAQTVASGERPPADPPHDTAESIGALVDERLNHLAHRMDAWDFKATAALIRYSDSLKVPRPASPAPADAREHARAPTVAEAARVLLDDLQGAIDGERPIARWLDITDAMEAAPSAFARPTPLQMMRAALTSLATDERTDV